MLIRSKNTNHRPILDHIQPKPMQTRKVFVSYCRCDASEAGELVKNLKSAGLEVWWDEDLIPGEEWAQRIAEEIKASDSVILCFSANAVGRERGTFYEEVRRAIEVWRTRKPGTLGIVPIKFSPCEIPAIPIDSQRNLDALQYVELYPPEKRSDSLRSLLATFGAELPDKLDHTFVPVLRAMGVVDVAAHLERPYDPESCMRQAERRLYFMGNFGSKWVKSEAFIPFLRRIHAFGGKVQFLLVDPEGAAFKSLKTHRRESLSQDPRPNLERMAVLSKEYPCLSLRLYDSMPCFRLVFIDERRVVFSTYRIDEEGYARSKDGWKAPQMLISREPPWSMYTAFERYYNECWENAKPYGS